MHPKLDSVRFLLKDGLPHKASRICSGLNLTSDELEEITNHLCTKEYTLLISLEGGDFYYQLAGGPMPWETKLDPRNHVNFLPQ